jgi:hypothetical protein
MFSTSCVCSDIVFKIFDRLLLWYFGMKLLAKYENSNCERILRISNSIEASTLVYIRQRGNNKILDSSAHIQKVLTEFSIFKNNLFERLCLLQFPRRYELCRPFFKATNQAAAEHNVSAFLAILKMQRFVISQQIDRELKYMSIRKKQMTK